MIPPNPRPSQPNPIQSTPIQFQPPPIHTQPNPIHPYQPNGYNFTGFASAADL